MAYSWPQRLQRSANSVLNKIGLHLVRRERTFEMDGLLARAAARGTTINTWIDVGASDGSWSLRARRHFPAANFLLFEPLEERREVLASLSSRHGFHIAHAAAGAGRGELAFSIDPLLDGSGVAAPGAADTRRVPVDSIDNVVAERQLAPPYGLKLDTHGHELPVLAGAAATLEAAELLIIEAYNFQLVPGSLRFHELCACLEPRGFRCCDLADPMRRPRDGALWQMDLAFARTTNALFATDDYD